MISPISATLQKAYRDTLLCNAAPAFLDTDEKIIPVAVIANASSPSNSQNVIITDGTDQAVVTTGGRLNVSVEPTSTLSSERTYKAQGFRQSTAANTQYTVYTPTGGKSLYITSLWISNGAASTFFRWGDNVGASAIASATPTANQFQSSLAAGATYFFQFAVPLKISTALTVSCDTANDLHVNFVGYEE